MMSSRLLFLLIVILIPSICLAKATLKLTFSPDDKYFAQDNQVDIICELLNAADPTESPQLWHVDLKTGKHTAISRSLINTPPDDSPDVFKQNRNKRLEFVKKNHIRIRRITLEDSARYECNCPDCEQPLDKQVKDLSVMKLVEPRWHIEPNWPLQENIKTTLRCSTDDFYPYVSHKVIRHHHDITNDGKATLPNSNIYPQKFSWEATVMPTADWHNTTLRCTVMQGNSEQHGYKYLDVIFAPRFIKCEERQHIDSAKEKATIECEYSGNPQPKLTWFRQSDGKPLNDDVGINIQTKDEHHGKYRSIVTFDRDKLLVMPVTTTAKSPNGQIESSTVAKIMGDNYYQQLLSGGFIAKLFTSNNNEEKGSQKIQIVGDATQARVNPPDSSSISSRKYLSTSILFFSLTMLLHFIQHP